MTRLLMFALVLALAGCGGSKSTDKSSTVKLAGSKLGQILVDSKGRTLYLFEADTNGKSTCSGTCAATWPPLTVASPSAGSGVDDGALATTKRADGTQQVTYHGHPLYFFALDKKAGNIKGQGYVHFGGTWWAVSAAGAKITTKP